MKLNWNERYQDESFFYGKEPNDFLKENIELIKPGSKILCLAEGEGRNAVYLATKGFFVTAIDQSSVGLEKLKLLASENNVIVETMVADLNDYQIEENKWDVILSIWCHLPSELRKKVHANCVKGLTQNGIFILEAYNPKQLELKTGGPDNIDFLMTESSLNKELIGLNFTTILETTREINEGQGHKGLSAVVQCIAVKS